MRRIPACSVLAVALGCILLSPAPAAAYCLHGLLHCRWCYGGYNYNYGGYAYGGYNTTGTPAPGMGGTPAPSGGNTAGVATAPGLIPAYPGMVPYGYAPVASSPQPRSHLDGYDPNAPIVPAGPGTVLWNGQLFGSHIFDVLKRSAGALNESGLLDLAIRTFARTSGFQPTAGEIEILRGIAQRVLRDPQGLGSTTPGPGTTVLPPGTGTTSTIGAGTGPVVTVVVPPGVSVMVITNYGTGTGGTGRAGAAGAGGSPGGGAAAGGAENSTGTAAPPAEAPPAAPPAGDKPR
jgi:hypothetical protein